MPHPTSGADALVGCDLPLSWARGSADPPQLAIRQLPLSRLHWVAQADLPFGWSFERVYHEHLTTLSGALIRGCSPSLAGFLQHHGWEVARVGMEAIVDLEGEGLQRRSVVKMVKQARHHGAAREVAWSTQAAAQLREFAARARYAGRPQLRDLFRNEFTPGTRLFVFDREDDRWQGAILLSVANRSTVVTELMLRLPEAPGGVMESLFACAGARLRTEGVRQLSLNEAPFFHLGEGLRPNEWLISAVGRQMGGAYNAVGLQRFKAKFAPHWRPVYLCARPRLSLLALTDLFAASGCLRLTLDSGIW
ncbi:MAG: DUF2156 domain-containing protein [Oscillochloris sp.]|nr:DUF2156 domain-containing protein [Oscillochloris sp.]